MWSESRFIPRNLPSDILTGRHQSTTERTRPFLEFPPRTHRSEETREQQGRRRRRSWKFENVCAFSRPTFCGVHDFRFSTNSKVRLTNGELRSIGNITEQDFVDACQKMADISIERMTVIHMKNNHEDGTVTIGFVLADDKTQVVIETTPEHPFFDPNRGWTSYDPLRTWRKHGISSAQLSLGSCCFYLLDCGSDADK